MPLRRIDNYARHMDVEKLGLRLTDMATGQPEFLCPRDGKYLWEDKPMARFICTNVGCNFELNFHQVQRIAQWLRSYA